MAVHHHKYSAWSAIVILYIVSKLLPKYSALVSTWQFDEYVEEEPVIDYVAY